MKAFDESFCTKKNLTIDPDREACIDCDCWNTEECPKEIEE